MCLKKLTQFSSQFKQSHNCFSLLVIYLVRGQRVNILGFMQKCYLYGSYIQNIKNTYSWRSRYTIKYIQLLTFFASSWTSLSEKGFIYLFFFFFTVHTWCWSIQWQPIHFGGTALIQEDLPTIAPWVYVLTDEKGKCHRIILRVVFTSKTLWKSLKVSLGQLLF